MKKLVLSLIFLSSLAFGQPAGVFLPGVAQQPAINLVTQSGAVGTTTYCYWVVAVYTGGKSAPAGPICMSSANATLSSTNFNTVAFSAPTSPLATPSGFDLLRTTTATPPTGACACAVSTAQAGSPLNDQSNTLSAYTVSTATSQGNAWLDMVSNSLAQINMGTVGVADLGVASASGTRVNRALVTSSVTGNPVIYGVQGTDANIPISITAKGTGAVTINSLGQATTTSPFTSFTTLSAPNNLIAPGSTTDSIAEFWSQIYIPNTVTLTGACLLNGATVTTDKHIYFLTNAAGVIIANTALASVADSGASRYQCQNFTSTVLVPGPGTYFVGTQPNGTTDNFFTYATGGAPTNYGTGTTAAGVFGTLVNITPTVTFTNAVGPLMMVF